MAKKVLANTLTFDDVRSTTIPAGAQRIDASGIPYPIFHEGEMTDLLGFLGAFADVSR